MQINYTKELQQKILSYYERYYKSCGLNDFKQRAQDRLSEETAESKKMKALQETLKASFQGQKHFIFGAGTAGLAVVLSEEYGVEVFGIEPSKEEFEIIQEKLKWAGIPLGNFKKEYGESLSFESCQFGFVHCFTVLEHVKDVEKCIQEMIRITKPGGLIYINTPNYGSFEERHYKIRFPFPLAYTPRFLSYFYLILRGKPFKFLRTINFLTERRLDKILSRQKEIEWSRLKKGRNQEIVVRKL